MAASSSTAAQSYSNQWYHVFISRCGVDVKKTFARSLYLRLLDTGLKAFLDQEELQRGYDFPSQLKHFIATASVHVAILSPGYAKSYWCLQELLMMLETNAPIIPVFYRVKPAEVRWTKRGKYAEALEELANKTDEGKLRYDSNTIEKWRKALSKVADIIGFEAPETCNGEELELELQLELVDKVVQRVCELVKRQKPNFTWPTIQLVWMTS